MISSSTKYSPEVHKRIVDCVRDGNYRKVAAGAGGIAEQTLMDWLEAGRAGTEPFAALLRDIEDAEREAEAEMVLVVRENAKEDWHAASWYLARKHPDRWGQTQKTELTGANGGPVQTLDVTKLSDDELERRIAELSGTRTSRT